MKLSTKMLAAGVLFLLTIPLFFAGIGLGFMFVEIGLIQRLSIFLGHPTYGFTVVLFGLFVSTSIGSMASTEVLTSRSNRFRL